MVYESKFGFFYIRSNIEFFNNLLLKFASWSVEVNSGIPRLQNSPFIT